MGLPTDSYIDVEIGGDVVDKIGLSTSLTNISDIISGGYCGMRHLLWRNGQTKTDGDKYTVGKLIPVELSGASFPITISKGTPDYNYPDGMYCGVVWLYSENSPMDYCINSSNISDYKLVTEWDAPHYVYKPSDLQEAGHWVGKTHLSWANNDISGYVWNNGYNNNFMKLEYWDDNEGTNVVNIDHIRPYLMYQNENGKYFLSIYDYSYQSTFFYADTDTYSATTTLEDYTESENMAFCVAIETLGVPNELPKTATNYYAFNTEGYTADGSFGVYFDTSSSVISGHSGYFAYSSEYAMCKKNDVFLDIAGNGLKFYTDKLYKPIISGGVVIGYTDDMDEESELDEWTGTTDHGIGPTPPSPTPPTPSSDDYDNMELGLYNGKMGGLTKFAIMSTQDLVDLIIDYNTNAANAGSNFSNHIICLYRLGINPALLTTATSGKIVMIKSAGDVDFESQANYSLVTDQATLIDCGSIDVPRNTGTFYDFSPYTSYELYIPGCGWIPLPDNVAGRTIRAYIIFDFPSCSAKGIVRISGDGLLTYGTTIATVNGVIGAPVPFTIGENGQQRAGIMSANAQVASGIATGIVGGALSNPYMMVAGGSNLVGGLISAYTAGNTNYVSTKGGAADFSMFGDGGKAILKINSPVVDSVVTKPLFGHTVGYMCNELGTLSNFHGFTVCTNPHIHINATSTEKEEIKQLLEEGVILP